MPVVIRLLVVLLAASCSERPLPAASDPAGSVALPFHLVCDSADTRESSTLFCVRLDTRDGDVRRVDLSKLPQSNGPTRAAAGPAGTYQLVCDSTNTEVQSDFRCVRLHRQTGELLLVRLPKVGVIPE